MDSELEGMLDRAAELLEELEREYERCLRERSVSERAKNLTHEVLEKVRNALDHTMRRAWVKYTEPNLSAEDRRHARVYFPVAKDEQRFQSILGMGRMKGLKKSHKDLYDFVVSQQPFSSPDNRWLQHLAGIAAEGKHIVLAPQTRTETQRYTVSKGGGSASWDPSRVRFKGEFRVLGAPIDPRTQRIVPTEGVSERVETWVAFVIDTDGYKVNALVFCKEACRKAHALIENMVRIGQL